jgi:hypothetical protein
MRRADEADIGKRKHGAIGTALRRHRRTAIVDAARRPLRRLPQQQGHFSTRNGDRGQIGAEVGFEGFFGEARADQRASTADVKMGRGESTCATTTSRHAFRTLQCSLPEGLQEIEDQPDLGKADGDEQDAEFDGVVLFRDGQTQDERQQNEADEGKHRADQPGCRRTVCRAWECASASPPSSDRRDLRSCRCDAEG